MLLYSIDREIECSFNSSAAWYWLAQNVKLHGGKYLKSIQNRFVIFKLKNDNNSIDYIIRLWTWAINFCSFLLELKKINNLFINKFDANLSSDNTRWFKKEGPDYESSGVHKKVKYSFSLCIYLFQNRIRNILRKSIPSLKKPIMVLLSFFYTNYLSLNSILHTSQDH